MERNTKDFPLVSVITTVYNTEKYVDECFMSILNQTYKNFELVVVDNASQGNIKKIVNNYQKAFPNVSIKLIENSKNVGLFHARLIGTDNASGDFLSFIDSDDKFSVNYLYKLVTCAVEKDADIVGAEFVDGHPEAISFTTLDNLRIADFDLYGPEIFKQYINAHGTSFSWFAVWNKLYRRDLWERCSEFFRKIKKPLVLAEDIVYSTILFSKATHFVNIHGVYYNHNIHPTASSSIVNKARALKNICDLYNAFECIRNYLESTNLLCKYKDQFDNFRRLHAKFWMGNISGSSLSYAEKIECMRIIQEKFSLHSDEFASELDTFFYSITNELAPHLEFCYQTLIDPGVDIISFDIFDTLLVRNTFDPQDIFNFLSVFYNKLCGGSNFVDFSILRKEGELRARERMRSEHPSFEDITIDEIYDSISECFSIDRNILTKIREKEIELEYQLCHPRKFAKELYELALFLGKKVVCISDMYLDESTISKLLIKNGYTQIYKIYVSSACRLTKASGNLYKYVLKDLGISHKRILHIGDNVYSDIQMFKYI